jgi:hypothetical protein
MKTPQMYIAIPHGELFDAMLTNGVPQARLNELEDIYLELMCDGSYDRTGIYTSEEDLAELEPEVATVVRGWIAAGFVPQGEKYSHFILYYDK